MLAKLLAFLAPALTFAKSALLVILGDVEKVAAGIAAEIPLSGMACRALAYFVPLCATLTRAFGWQGLVSALIATVVVTVVNVIRLLLHLDK